MKSIDSELHRDLELPTLNNLSRPLSSNQVIITTEGPFHYYGMISLDMILQLVQQSGHCDRQL